MQYTIVVVKDIQIEVYIGSNAIIHQRLTWLKIQFQATDYLPLLSKLYDDPTAPADPMQPVYRRSYGFPKVRRFHFKYQQMLHLPTYQDYNSNILLAANEISHTIVVILESELISLVASIVYVGYARQVKTFHVGYQSFGLIDLLDIPHLVRNSAQKTFTTLISFDAHTEPTYTITRDTTMFL